MLIKIWIRFPYSFCYFDGGFSGCFQSDEVPSGHQPSTHRFLLSLLATSLFLSIPSVASQALSLILKTIGPTTVIDYLDFACGKCMIYSNPLPEDCSPAIGLENLALYVEEPEIIDTHSTAKSADALKSNSSDLSLEDSKIEDSIRAPEPSYHYGAVSDKIGQAVVCWLARWGVDMFMYEVQKDYPSGSSRSPADRLFKRSIAHLRQRALSVPESRPSSAPTPSSPFSASKRSDKTEDYLVPSICLDPCISCII